jgi:hypothetical protein
MTRSIGVFLISIALLAACTPQSQQAMVTASIIADGTTQSVTLNSGNTVQQALNSAGVTISQSDRVNPPVYTIILNGTTITITRVREEFETRQVIIPFERQELHNESLPSGEIRLVQAGQNGLRELTVRHVYENGLETSNSIVSDSILQSALPEIVMIGVQSPFAPLPITGILAYLTSGNAWVMINSTSNRYPLVTTGDLDGRIFTLSPDGKWLLFSRKSSQPPDKETNTLWVINTSSQSGVPVNLGISNVPTFAAWEPGSQYIISYSSVEPRASAPGWQANNDLHFLAFTNGKPGKKTDILETNSGGIYGWWGMSFSWSPDGDSLAYSRPDSVGLVDIAGSGLTPLLQITPVNTHGDWAWTPGLSWGADGKTLYVVTHAPPSGLVSPEESPNFDLDVISLTSKLGSPLIHQTGMFANPAVSRINFIQPGSDYLVSFMQAVFPAQSATSRYLLKIMNSDGTDLHTLFPAEGQTGLTAQIVTWSPRITESSADLIAVIYEGNLWIVDPVTSQSQQVTGDELTSKIDWR